MATPNFEALLPIERLQAIIALPRSAWQTPESMHEQVMSFTTVPSTTGTASSDTPGSETARASTTRGGELFMSLEDLSHCATGGEDLLKSAAGDIRQLLSLEIQRLLDLIAGFRALSASRIQYGDENVLKRAICQVVSLRWIVEDETERVATRLQQYGNDMQLNNATNRH
nr:hypothetical protein CFP56_43939 [Quercus suber]